MKPCELERLKSWCEKHGVDPACIDSSLTFQEAKQDLLKHSTSNLLITKKDEMQAFILDSINKISELLKPAEKQIRKLAEFCTEIQLVAKKEFGLKAGFVFGEIARGIGYSPGYLQELCYIPKKLYPDMNVVFHTNMKSEAGDILERAGYTKFFNLAQMGNDSERRSILKEAIEKGLSADQIQSRVYNASRKFVFLIPTQQAGIIEEALKKAGQEFGRLRGSLDNSLSSEQALLVVCKEFLKK